MKQTNNAIKFLMAQYRAIFKNANLKMFLAAATAAAAMAAGSAQAATAVSKWEDIKTNASSGAVNFDEDNLALKITGATADATDDTNALKVTISKGANTIDGDGKGAWTLTGSQYDLTLDSDANAPTLTIGGTNGKITVDVNSVTTTSGTLTLGGKGSATKADAVALKANVITLGGHDTKTSTADVKGFSSLIGKESLTVGKGATLKIAADGAAYGAETTINDGTVELAGTLGSTASTVNINSGSVTVAAATTGSIAGSSITLTNGKVSNEGTLNIGSDASTISLAGGTIENKGNAGKLNISGTANLDGAKLDVQSGSVTFAGESHFNKGEVVNSGTIVLNGNSSIEAGVFKTIGADGELKIGNAKVDLTAAAFKDIVKGKITASGDGSAISELHFKDEAAFNLGGDGKGANDLQLLQDTNGNLNAKITNPGDGVLKVTGKEATFSGDKLDAGITVAFNKMTLGKTNFTISGSAGVEAVETLTIGSTGSGDLTVAAGNLTLNGDSGSVAAKSITLNDDAASLDVKKGSWSIPALTITKGNAKLGGAAVVDVTGDLTVTSGSVGVNEKAQLNIKASLSTAGTNGNIDANAGIINTFGSKGGVTLKADGVKLANTAVLNLEAEDIFTSGTVTLDNAKFEENAVTGEANTTIAIQKDGQKLSLTKDEFTALQTAVGDSFKGLFDVDVTGITVSGSEMPLKDVVSNIQTSAYDNVTATTDGTDVNKVYSVGNIKIEAEKDLNLAAGGALTLNHANADGQFVSKQSGSGTAVAGVVFKDAGNSLTLGGSGEIGSVTSEADGNGVLTIGSTSAQGVVTVKGDIGATGDKNIGGLTVNVGSDLVVSGDVYTNKLDMRENTSLDVGAGSVLVENSSIKGDITAGTLTLSGTASDSHLIAGNANVNVGTLIVGGPGVLTVGMDGESGSSASVFTQTLDIKDGSVLFVDPDYTKPAAFVVTQDLKDTAGSDVGVLNGDIYVGKNAAFGYGFDEAEFKSLMANYLNSNGAFNKPEDGGIQNALVINKSLTIANGDGIVVDPAFTGTPVSGKAGNSLKLASGGALILTDAALSGANAAIKFSTNATVTADSGSVVSLFGEFTAKDTNLKFFEATGGTVTLSNDIHVEALGGMLEGTLSKTATTVCTLDKLALSAQAKDIAYNGVSTPVGDLFMAVAAGDFVGSAGLGYDFVTGSMSNKQFKAVDAAAHAATYAGAQQAAVASVGTMADAIVGRVGSMGVEAASIAATGSQANGGVWVTPMYKSVDADGFGAQGTSYGADVDLAGVAFGTDTVNGNMRFGAVFNIGSGDSDGKGQGSGLKDEFDYYGIGIYSAMGFGSFALVGDASLNVISHDVEGLGLKGEADTTAVTMGVTGQYTIASPMVDVTPHLGARFIRLDTDSYDLTSANGVLATTDFEVQNVFSVPLGVTLSKAFEMGGWSLAPSADLTITFNAGDTEAESTTRFAGINRNIGLTTEVLDEVTYGVAVGLGAQYGAFGTSFNVNYTGSENTDALGVNAQARYMF